MTLETVWEQNYRSGRYNKYPYDDIVSFLLTTFPSAVRTEKKILDLGCGGGNNFKFLVEENFDAYGIDSSETSVLLTKKHANQSEDSNKVILGSFLSLPYTDNFFDCVIDRQSMGHNVFTDIEKIIKEIHRVLKPGGFYFGQVFSDAHPHCKYGQKLNELGDMNNFSSGAFTKSGLVHFFNFQQIKELFSDFNLVNVIQKNSKPLIEEGPSKHENEYFLIIAKNQ